MNDISTGILLIVLIVLILLSAFFSGSETALMTLNRYRLKHLSDEGHRGAKLARRLLNRPDRLLGLILLGNNFVNILASAIATIIALRLHGEAGIAIATGLLTLTILIFAEVTPKTLAALKPEKVAFVAAYIYTPLLKILYPFVWMVNAIANRLLALVGVHAAEGQKDKLNADEFRAVVNEANQIIPGQHTEMLLRILDLENTSVEDIMIPRNEITGIDLTDDWNDIERQITHSQRTRVPVFHDSIDHTVGVIHLRKVLNLFARGELNLDSVKALIRKAYFIPAGTSLTRQLLNFQKKKRRSALVVDEYGSIQGLVTLEDILEEIVGRFTTDSPTRNFDIHTQEDGSFLVDGGTHIRDINRNMNWSLPQGGPKTLNGLILEHMEMIPEPGTSLLIENYSIEIMRTSKNAVQSVRIKPLHKDEDESDQDDEFVEDKARD
ncbi:MAG: HlyC/CorC family transporter [Gammaproteobacteria bacterium]|nr:HlyC/CorC family transporter [Gammaproteobacteria bacterium]MCK5262669.1 HlyC/CorC family transporter [Gammaproteobacteria bacterium]